jgi:hypothetical protein
MRLWSLHPKYLDAQGLVALWREGLLAQKVLWGKTRGYKKHPQLERFKDHPQPKAAIAAYLFQVREEARGRGYQFDPKKIGREKAKRKIPVTTGQLKYEFYWLLRKLKKRAPKQYRLLFALKKIQTNPFFRIVPGAVQSWEKLK